MRLLIILFLSIPAIASAQDYHLPLTKDSFSGLYHLNASLNNVSAKFIFDTGASGIVVNGDFYNRLVQQGSISQRDYKGPVRSIIADGSTVSGSLYNIRRLEAGNLVLSNVEVTVMPQANAGMLIGQTFLSQFGKVTLDLDNNRLILAKKAASSPATLDLNEIRLIPCFTTNDKFDQLKSIVKSIGINVSQYTQEEKVPPTSALQRINSRYTIRYFDSAMESLSLKLVDQLSREYPNLSVSLEDMRPFYGGSNIPAYIEIWIK